MEKLFVKRTRTKKGSRAGSMLAIQRRVIRACSSARSPLSLRQFCSAPALDAYHERADITIEGLLEVFEEVSDDAPELGMEIDYAVPFRLRGAV